MSRPVGTFKVGRLEHDRHPERVIVRATAPDGRHLTVTGRRADGYRLGDLLVVERVAPD